MNNEKDSQTKLNKSVISLLRRLSTWRCLHLLLSIGPTVIDWYLLQTPTRRSAAANPPATCCCRMMRQTDGRTLDRYTDPAPHTTRALSKSCIMIYFLSYTMGFSHKSILLTTAEAESFKDVQMDNHMITTVLGYYTDQTHYTMTNWWRGGIKRVSLSLLDVEHCRLSINAQRRIQYIKASLCKKVQRFRTNSQYSANW